MCWHIFRPAASQASFSRHPVATRLLVVAGVAAAVMLGVAVSPVAALDSAADRSLPASGPLPMFKDPRAALRLGIEKDHSGSAGRSLEALRYAADGGESIAQWKLGRMYAGGDGVTRDDAKAFAYFSKIIEQFSDDDPDPNMRSMAASAFVAVGNYLRKGVPGAKISPDPDRAFELFRYAATYFGAADAQYHLARMYLEGGDVKQDVRQGLNWLDLAARKGHVEAQAMLGQLMFDGVGGRVQRPRGLMYLTLARDSVASASSDEQWIVDLHARALKSATDADRKAAFAMLDDYLKRRN